MPENGNVQTPNKSQVYMSRFSSLLCSLLFCMITYAQEITVTGKVTAGGEEMPGVTVAVKDKLAVPSLLSMAATRFRLTAMKA